MRFTLKIAKPKERHHRALFDDELPFKPKVERNRTKYQRHQKYRNTWEREIA